MTDPDVGDARDAQAVGRARAAATSYGDRDRVLEAIHALEAAVGRPAVAAAASNVWAHPVRQALSDLETAFGEQRSSYDDPSGLMATIAHDEPRLRTWVRQLRHRWAELEATTGSLHQAMDGSDDGLEIHEARERVRWLASAVRHHREREADLVFDALKIDLGERPDRS